MLSYFIERGRDERAQPVVGVVTLLRGRHADPHREHFTTISSRRRRLRVELDISGVQPGRFRMDQSRIAAGLQVLENRVSRIGTR